MKPAVLVMTGCLVMAAACAATTIVVDLNGGGDYSTLSQGIFYAESGDTVLVAPGLYTGPLNRDLSFEGKEIVLMPAPGARDPVVIDAEGEGRCFLFENNEGPEARIERIVLEHGVASDGGGIRCIGLTSPTFVDCEFIECAAYRGAGMDISLEAAPTLVGCVFRENTAGAGGGLRCSSGSSADLQDCYFKGNSADFGGGVMVRDGSSATVDGTVFEDNYADWSGGLRCEDSAVTITNSFFSRNDAQSGGGLGSGSTGMVTLRYCVFYENTAIERGAGYACGTPADIQYCTFVLGQSPTGSGVFAGPPEGDMAMSNCIVAFGEGPAMTCDPGGAPTVTRCCFYGNAGGNTPCALYSDILCDNPWFCAMPLRDLTVNEVSVCLPANNPWGVQMGAFGAGCAGAVPVESASWATIKAMYR